MLATSLAWLLSTDHERSTALLDLDVHFGTGALTLDLEPGRGLLDAIENPGRIDTLFIERAMIRANDRLSIMSAEAPMTSPLLTDGTAFVQLAAEFRESFQASVIDLPRAMMMNFPQLLAEVNTLVVTTELTLAAARDTIRVLSWLKTNAPQVQPLIVANKVQAGALEISEADFASATERKIDLVIPYDHKAAVNAAKRGKPFVEANRGAKSVAPLLEMANRIVAGDTGQVVSAKPKSSSSLLGGLDLMSLLSRGGKDGGAKPAAAQG
jgi:pilus assembly protein CpaE